MKINTFYKNFGTEEKCIKYLKDKLEKRGIKCKNCSNSNLKWSTKENLWRCKCSKRITIKSITFMRDSNLTYQQWLEGIYWVLDFKKNISINELCTKIDIDRFETIKYMMHKIRKEMGAQEKQLSFDEVFTLEIKNEVAYKGNLQLYIKRTQERNRDKIKICFEPGGFVKYDDSKTRTPKITNLKPKRLEDVKVISSIQNYWKSVIIKNLERVIDGIHHDKSERYTQLYFDQYCYKYNQRKCENIFEKFVAGFT